jgi:hypothetical protein
VPAGLQIAVYGTELLSELSGKEASQLMIWPMQIRQCRIEAEIVTLTEAGTITSKSAAVYRAYVANRTLAA